MGWLQGFLEELDHLQRSPEREISTTLLVLERGPEDFDDFLSLVDNANDLLDEAGLRGHVQLAHFHPRYRFAAEPAEALSHYTNRSPLPTLHLLRESTLSRVLANYPAPEAIPARNIARLEALGRDRVRALWSALER